MYVIFPAEEVVELTLRGIVSHQRLQHHLLRQRYQQQIQEGSNNFALHRRELGESQDLQHVHPSRQGTICNRKKQEQPKQQKRKSQSKATKKTKQNHKKSEAQQGTQEDNNMATGGDITLRDVTHPSLNEALKAHNAVTFKLVRTVSDFTQQLSHVYEHHAEELQLLVSNFRKKNAELRKERPACPSSLFHTWETLLQEVEIDSQAHSDIASILGRQVSRPLLERSFHRKIQSRKVFTHRESYETILTKTEDKLAKCRQDYKNAYLSYLLAPTTTSLSSYFDAHNAYVQQLQATNGMLDQYNQETLPQLLQELEEVYSDLCSTLSESVLQGAEIISTRALEQSRRYDGLSSQCRAVAGPTDLAHFVRSLPTPQHNPHHPSLHHNFVAPLPPPPPESPDGTGGPSGEPLANDTSLNPPPPLKNEIVVDRLASVPVRGRYESLKKEATELESQIKQLHDALDTLLRIQQRSLESSLYNKANELQEDISMKRFDLRVAQIHLGAVRAQKELFASKVESASDSNRERKMSSSSTGSMKNKWLKAFKSLKTTSTPSNGAVNKECEKKNGKDREGAFPPGSLEAAAHTFQEYTYKKITPCDVCSQVLRGHTRQGLKCRVCKLNVHVDCQEKVGRCQPKSRLLRRQKSTSEIETRIQEPLPDEEKPQEIDLIYQVLKQAGEISSSRSGTARALTPAPPAAASVKQSEQPNGTGSTAPNVGSFHRRSGPTQQQPLLLRGAASSLTVGPVPHASISDISAGGGANSMLPDTHRRRRMFAGMKSLSVFGGRNHRGESPTSRSISLPETPHSPRKQKLNLRMKSLSLDSPESTEHVQRRRHAAQAQSTCVDLQSSQSSSSRIQCPLDSSVRSGPLGRRTLIIHNGRCWSTPSSPVHNRRLLSARNMRMSSVELPDDNEKSLSSASTSPCPSPKPHRLLPTNLYVVLYNFKSRHPDELDLKAGYKVTVIDTSDQDWWKGKCLGRIGYFPSKYVIKLQPGERPLQVTHNLQVSDGDNGLMLLRDQIVIQVGEELDGMVMIRSGDSRQGVCPLKFLQEV
ncbi:uncharacterized protein LOC111874632 isoform X2 [Cryptotermes secundus]|uniref:uncharacterized protein LOC111874632 isoform X2 n=1 Tax=Cryptotermes secundus TaxID=105785 RepID=UPI001454C2CC|nr:uncharacterized protein LOC111874632 isoform X2 [Cryptotermes secundus]